MAKESNRILYIDILRVISVFAVVLLHISASFVVDINANGIKWWWIGNIIDSATRWSVPVLILISGQLMLDKSREEEIVPFLRKRLTKIFIPLITWSFIYMLWVNRLNIQWNADLILSFLKNFYLGKVHIHLWYLYMIFGLYLVTPILRPYVNNAKKDNLVYFIVVWFISNGIIGFSQKFTEYTLAFNLSFFHWGIGFYLLGFYLSKYSLSKKQRKLLYFLGFLGLIVTIYGTYILTKNNGGIFVPHLYSNYAPNVMFTAIAIFELFKNINWHRIIGDNKIIKRIISSISKTSFGIYLVHLLILNIISSGVLGIAIDAASFNPIIGIPLVSVITFILSHFIVMILQKIPLLNIIVPK
ncbi:acyltransferase family protein [Tissierella sp.]|uniref:acyltransferase n=1 Tax=Tissierella sp. TaxID=41274 RepID=UPI002862F393|nr:acyltransferase family protein [Tissierella sp.]MDR7857531.1 acyltransferase family protein [Tissierella sp.]